jgi:putative aldouronate transport system substrate-binding protein
MKDVTLNVLINWNGSEALGPKDPINNSVAKVIKEKTGVTLNLQYAKMDEAQQLNTIFATQELPDIVASPAWVFEPLAKAAKENQIMELTDIFKEYPLLATNADPDHTPAGSQENLFDVVPGKKFFMYGGYPATPDDLTDWLYGFYVRKDIAEKTGIDPTTIHTPDDLYTFLKTIKDLDLKQDGKTIFPLGSFQGGWWLQYANKMFTNNNADYSWASGSPEYQFMSDKYTEQTLYFRKLISEGLIDPEAFTQTAAVATEKVSQGRYATLSAHFYHLYDATRSFVNSHPDSEYVPVGPLNNMNGDPNKAVAVPMGSNAVFLTKNCSDPEAAARVLAFLASDEGWLLTHYGVEGVHYDMVDGKPVAKKEWLDKEAATPGTLKDEGFGTNLVYSYLAGQDRTVSKFGGPFGWQTDKKFQMVQDVKKVLRPNGIELLRGYDPGQLALQFPGYEKLKPVLDQISQIAQQAIFAKSDEAAKKLLDDARKELEKAGIHDLEKFLNDQAAQKEILKDINA